MTGSQRSFNRLTTLIDSGELLILPTLVLYEWLRGPRTPEELRFCGEIFPADAVVFGSAEARVAARLYRKVRRARMREIDLAIAATAIVRGGRLWTLNRDDFADIEGLSLI